jgi:hypothetical protein
MVLQKCTVTLMNTTVGMETPQSNLSPWISLSSRNHSASLELLYIYQLSLQHGKDVHSIAGPFIVLSSGDKCFSLIVRGGHFPWLVLTRRSLCGGVSHKSA